MLDVDYIVVGSGLTGATIARQLYDAGREVIVLEKRSHLGGNCFDTIHEESGIRYSVYGPHYFRTNSLDLWNWVTRFAEFRVYSAVVKIMESGAFYDWPISQNVIDDFFPDGWELDDYAGQPDFEGECLKKMPREIYETFIEPYTEKQWGRPARQMNSSLASRIEIRRDNDNRLSTKAYQGVPVKGYTNWISNILSGIPLHYDVDYLSRRDEYTARKMLIFTGAIDAYFEHRLGNLEYRSQEREVLYFPTLRHIQHVPQVNYPTRSIKTLREIEWKHIWPYSKMGTLVTRERPVAGGEEYPVPDAKNQALYTEYRKMADAIPDTLICGRLGEFTYYDMDQAIARALKIAETLCAS